jgi:aryl-alcohol dehydrogenase-like predicted oxidoreductase
VRTRHLGKTGLEVSELALGTWTLGGEAYGPVEEAEIDRTVARARELGITLIETADSYGHGEGREPIETRIGRLLERDEQVRFCTKGGNDLAGVPPRKRFDRMFLHRSAARSADRLRRAPDLYLLHHPTVETLRRGEAIDALKELARDKVIKQWGVACGDAETVRAAIEAGAAVVELAYNLLHQRDLIEAGEEITSSGVGVLARSPLAYGLLCGIWPADKTFPEGDHRRDRWPPEDLHERLRQVAALRPLVHDEIHTLRSAALRFVLSNQLVSSCVVGVRGVAQLEANVRVIGTGPPYLSEDDLARVPTLLSHAGATI